MKRFPRPLNRMAIMAPWLALAALAGLSSALPNQSVFSADAEARKATIAAAMQAAPFFIKSDWVGVDAHDRIPREAQELLRPNAVLSRSYSKAAGLSVHVLIVHCHDARDMIGHYPPICYPSAGWVPRDPETVRDHEVLVGECRLPMREYIYSRPRDQISDDVIRVLNAFVLPDGRVTSRIDDINKQSERQALSRQGVAQVQVITLAALPLEEAREAAAELLGGMHNLLEALNVNQESCHDEQSAIN